MSNKNSESEPISVEKIRSNYPDISCLVNDNPTKVTEPSKNDSIQQSNIPTVTVTQSRIPSTQSVTVKCNSNVTNIQKIPSSAGDRKVPPYVNALPQDPVRVQKVHPQKVMSRVIPKPITEKVIVTTESATSTSSYNNKVPSVELKKCNVPPQIMRTNVSQTPTKPINKPSFNADKNAVVSTTVASDEIKSTDTSESSNKNTVEKVSLMIQARTPLMSRTSDVFEKNIQSNVLTVTPRPSSNTPSPKPLPSKDVKPNSADTPKSTPAPVSVSKNASSTKQPILSTESLCKNISKSVSVQCTETPPQKLARIVSANNTPKSDTVTKSIIAKATSTNDAAPKTTPTKITIAVTSTDSSNKTDEKSPTTKNINSRSVSPATTPSITKTVSKSPTANLSTPSTPKTQTYGETFAVPNTPSHPSVPSHISNNKNVTLTLTQSSGNLQLSSLSEIENNKDIREALNSGSTASIGENVTISSAGSTVGYYLIQSVSPKIRNVSSETTIENITKQPSNSNSSSTRSKNGNSNDSVGQSSKSESNSGPSTPSSQSMNEARTPKREAVSSTSHSSDELESPNPKISKKKVEEPVECLTISSDEEEAEPDHFVSSLSDTSDVSVSIMSKEPPIGKDDHVTAGEKCEREVESMLEATCGDGYTSLACRTVRIGSYKVEPRENVTVSQYGVKIVVPPLNHHDETVALKIPIHEIIKVLVHFSRSLPVIFYYVTASVGARVRNLLKMTKSSNGYFDPNGEEESHRRITLLPEKFTDDDKINIADLYFHRADVMAELTYSEANQLLIKSAPREVQRGLKQAPPNPVQTIMVFPPPPAKGGISINTEDYSCLAEDVFLNDVIIDFYLKYLFHKRLSDEDRQKTHIFSSFFYKRLTDKTTPVPAALQNSKTGDSAARAAEIRHHRVKTWTKNIDIFSKDYIVIPLNENQHWFLAIICFPGLKGPVRYSDNTPIDVDAPEKKDGENENSSSGENEASSSSQTMTIGSTTITPLLRVENSYSVCDDDDVENRDEADGADEDINTYTSSDDSDEDYSESEVAETGEIRIKPKNSDREPIKQPCILIFDSLAGASRARIIATLREYLRVEYKTKHGGEERDFSKNVVKGACPRVPQQTNYTDCGLYVLQYVESFFESKITDYHIPIKMIRYWFSPHTVSNKRYEIQQLLLQLMSEQNINIRSLHLPELKLSPRHHYYDSEEMEDYADDDDDLYDEGRLEHEYGYDELEEIEEHDNHVRASILEDDIDESEYIDEDEEIVGDEEKYSYGIYDSENDESPIEESSDEDIYKDIDAGVQPTGRGRRTVYHVRTKSNGDDETIHEEEEEIDEDDEDDDKTEQQFTERLVNLNNEDVTISRMPAGADDGERRLAELKAARPLKKFHDVSLEKATDGSGTPAKKFRSN